jgi:hypothetical protein
MPGEITKTDKNVKYTITHPDWTCEWIVCENMPVKRVCYLKNNVELLDKVNSDELMKIIPGLIEEVKKTMIKWISDGHLEVRYLLMTENKPALLEYAERTMGLKIIV